ncbi:hypothetical protein PGB90_009991 [Kerria lacca]
MFNEKQIVVLSGISGVLHLAACILLAIVWTYWSDTLNSCPETNCSCIFYGHLRGTSFIGGSPIWCSIITYYTLIAAIVSIGIAVYFFARIRNKPKDFPNRAIDSDGNIPRSRNRHNFSVSLKVFCGIFALLTFIYACILIEGYFTTCKEYKTLVARYLKASGDLSDLVTDRLSCGTVYDFLDYLHPDAITRYPYLPQYYHHRTFRINSGSIILISVVFSWLNVIIWSLITIFIGFCK